MARESIRSRVASEAGTAAIEYGLVLPVLLALFIGIIDVSRLVWTYTVLGRAAEAAARCGAVNKNACATETQMKNLAVAATTGITVSPTAFTVQSTADHVQVTANYDFAIFVPALGGVHHISVTARYPRKQ
jgi:Flp pilus assembly protein TadG